MMSQFEVIQMWNYHKDQYQDVLIERSFERGCARIAIMRWM
jgi:hypothetical protein